LRFSMKRPPLYGRKRVVVSGSAGAPASRGHRSRPSAARAPPPSRCLCATGPSATRKFRNPPVARTFCWSKRTHLRGTCSRPGLRRVLCSTRRPLAPCGPRRAAGRAPAAMGAPRRAPGAALASLGPSTQAPPPARGETRWRGRRAATRTACRAPARAGAACACAPCLPRRRPYARTVSRS